MTGTLAVDTLENSNSSFSIPTSYLKGRLVQRTTRFFFNTAVWNPGNSFYEVPGSWISITPLYDNSKIQYSWMCCMGHFGRQVLSITHFKFMCNGAELNRFGRSGDHLECGNTVSWELDSQGAGKTMRMGFLGRQYASNQHSAHFNARRYFNGADSTRAVPIWVAAEEYTTP